MNQHFTPIRVAGMKNHAHNQKISAMEVWKNWKPHIWLVRVEDGEGNSSKSQI